LITSIYNILNKIRSKITYWAPLDDWVKRYPANVEIGDGTYGHRIYIEMFEGLEAPCTSKAKLTIGKYTSIASYVKFILSGDHRKEWCSTYPFPDVWQEAAHIKGHPLIKGSIIVGNDVWIGHGCIILAGSQLGDGMIAGSGSVLSSKEYPPYSIVVGNPATIVGYRFPQSIIDKLLQVKWWDWPKDKIKANIDILCSPDFDKLFNSY
jgi:virginiamycin A acetyltransferase